LKRSETRSYDARLRGVEFQVASLCGSLSISKVWKPDTVPQAGFHLFFGNHTSMQCEMIAVKI
jgi:hypothetical protein